MKTSKPIVNQLLKRIRGRGRGAVLNSTDFLGLGSRQALDQALSRLARQGVILRLAPGLYHYPRTNKKMGVIIPPRSHEIAQAVVRKTKSRIIPFGALAANLLGLSTQVPAKAVYLTDGPARTIHYGSQTIIFRYAAPSTMAVSDKSSALVFQALRYLGRQRVTDTVIQKLSNLLPPKEKQALRKNIRYAFNWMKPVLEKIASNTKDGK